MVFGGVSAGGEIGRGGGEGEGVGVVRLAMTSGAFGDSNFGEDETEDTGEGESCRGACDLW